jgi:asparagine synthase (glutamine-hydrolysing)
MCGFLLTNQNLTDDEQLLVDLALRGPDSKNSIYYPQENVTSVFFRLGLLGSEEAAQQPRENVRFIFCFNGEVYNYKSIIKKHKLGQSNSDTQTCFEYVRYFCL